MMDLVTFDEEMKFLREHRDLMPLANKDDGTHGAGEEGHTAWRELGRDTK